MNDQTKEKYLKLSDGDKELVWNLINSLSCGQVSGSPVQPSADLQGEEAHTAESVLDSRTSHIPKS